jgi:hypothetical protein
MNWRRLLVLGIFNALCVWAPAAQADAQKATRAASRFDRGKALYNRGHYEEAIKAFEEAQRLTPHRATLFNIARCYQNLGQMDRALVAYRGALALTKDPAKRADLERRIAQLATRPVLVLVSSEPPGAKVTVDARARPESRRTPLMIKLRVGEHRLLFQRPGYRLTAKRIVVGREQRNATVKLQPASKAAERVTPCPKDKADAAELPRVDLRGLHLKIGPLSGLVLTADRGFEPGPGVVFHVTHNRLLVGMSFVGMIQGNRAIKPTFEAFNKTYDGASFRRLILQAEGGWIFPFRTFYLYGCAGVLFDRAIFNSASDDFVKERIAIAWSLGGGIEAMVARWFSIGVGLRAGVAHVVDDAISDFSQDVVSDDQHLLFGLLWTAATFHL